MPSGMVLTQAHGLSSSAQGRITCICCTAAKALPCSPSTQQPTIQPLIKRSVAA